MSNIRKTGLEFNATGNFEKKLSGYIKDLEKFNKAIAHTHQAMDKGMRGASGSGASAGLKNAREEAKFALLRQQTESKIAGINGKESAKSEVERQREQQANLKTMAQREKLNQIKSKGAASDKAADEKIFQFREAKISKLAREEQSHIEKLVQLRSKGARDEEIGAERVIHAKARTIMMEERLRRAEQRRHHEEETADQHRAQAFRARLKDTFGGGNLYGTGQSLASGGMGVLRGLANMGHDEQLHHYLVEKGGWSSMGLDKKSPGATQAGLDASEALRRRVPGMNMSGALDTVKDLQLITGDIKESTNATLLDQMGKFRVGMQTTYHLTDGQTYNAMKAADMLIQSRPGMSMEERTHQLMTNTDLITQATAGSGGKVNPNDVYGLLKQAKSNRFTLSSDGFRNLMPSVAELGGQRAGTEFTAFSSNVSGGRMPAGIAKNWMKLGLVQPGQVNYTDKGKFASVKSGGWVDSAMLYADPVAWLKKNVFPKAAKMSAPEAKAFFASLSGRVTTEDFIASNFFQRGQFDKDAASYKNAPGAAGLYGKQDPYLKAENEYNKALDTMHTKLGIAVLPGLTEGIKGLTFVIEGLNSAVDGHPGIAAAVASVVAGIGAMGALGGVGLMIKGAADGLTYLMGASKATAAAEATLATETTLAGSTAATAAAGLGVFLGQLAVIGTVAGGVGFSVGRLVAGTQNMFDAWDREKKSGDQANYWRGQSAITRHETLPFPARTLGRYPAGPNNSAWGGGSDPRRAGPAPSVVINHHPDPHKTTVTIGGKPVPVRRVQNAGHHPAPPGY